MQFNNTRVYNFEGAFRGMRNPMNSWDRGDSYFGLVDIYNENALTDVCDAWIDEIDNVARRELGMPLLNHDEDYTAYYDKLNFYENWLTNEGVLNTTTDHVDLFDVAFLGPHDLNLAQSLVLAGNEHAKFMRQIFVSIDITAPLYWWKEFDTYKVGTVANSTSTMHKLSSTQLTKDVFEFTNLGLIVDEYSIPHGNNVERIFEDYVDDIIEMCENLRLKFLETGDSAYWKALIQILPNAFLQTRTVTMSYANLRNIYFQRKNHKLSEWHDFCDWIKTLPYSKELITIGE